MGGRRPIGKVAMTAAERQRRYWLKAKARVAELEQGAATAASAKPESGLAPVSWRVSGLGSGYLV
jgi:hypothetical protein